MRQTQAALTDPDIISLGNKVYVVRPKRLKLPTDWDDIVRSDFKRKDWKRLRKTQYRVPDATPASCQLPVNQNKWPDTF
jgi:hypothetical protein